MESHLLQMRGLKHVFQSIAKRYLCRIFYRSKASGPVPIRPEKTGNVAVVNKMLALKEACKLCKTSSMGCKNPTGNICASSRITTELQILCNFRHREVRQAYSDSKNCTFVVTMIGASQFSVASKEGDRSSLLSCCKLL